VTLKGLRLLLDGVYLNGVPVPSNPEPDLLSSSFNNQSTKDIMVQVYSFMKTFSQFLKEMAGGYAIVSCKDRNNPNFQIWGAMSDLGCNKPKRKKKKKR
jgi:hypothetical protein